MKFTLFTANATGNQANTLYPNQVVISSKQDLLTAIKTDNACAEFKDYKRNIANFIKADCLVMDCDNDHSDDATAWISLKISKSTLMALPMQLLLVATI